MTTEQQPPHPVNTTEANRQQLEAELAHARWLLTAVRSLSPYRLAKFSASSQRAHHDSIRRLENTIRELSLRIQQATEVNP